MESFLSLAVVVVSIVLFLWLAPTDAYVPKIRRFNFYALAFLVVLCAAILVLCLSRAHSLELALLGFEFFLVLFVPMYVAGAGLLRCRLLSKFHGGGRSTI